MKVLFISRATLFTIRGGDTVQMEQTAAALQQFGVAVTIVLSNDKNIDYRQYNLIHFFNVIRPADILFHIRKSKLPFVLSPVYVEYNEQAGDAAAGFQHRILSFMGKHFREYVKTIGRLVRNKEKIVSSEYFFRGHQRSIEYILSHCCYLLPNSESEYKRLKRDFGAAGKYHVIPNAVDISVFHQKDTVHHIRDAGTVLCVARFEPRKNQLNVIRALNNTGYKVTFAGNIAPNHQAYYQACREEAGSNIFFMEFASPHKIASLLQQHAVHVLASWFETTGLSSLEAVACGCNIVITDKGDTADYFGKHAFYCDPADPASIKTAVDKAAAAPVDKAFMEAVKEHYNWEIAARETSRVYKKVLNS